MTPAEARAAMLAEGTLELWHGRTVLTAEGHRQLDAFLPTVPSLIAIYDVILAHPTLTIVGYDNPASADFDAARVQLTKAPDQFDRALRWLQSVPRIATPKHHSYWCKHAIQRQAGGYISQGALIAACLHMGIPMKRQAGSTGALLAIPLRELRQ